jgi:hypothetical protein
MAYRESRNYEISIKDAIEKAFDVNNYLGINVVRTHSQVNAKTLPCVVYRILTTTHNRVEVGDASTYRVPTVIIDIYANNDGQRLDMKDILISELKKGIRLYEWEVVDGENVGKRQIAILIVKIVGDEELYPNAEKNALEKVDRYRHRITLDVRSNIKEN